MRTVIEPRLIFGFALAAMVLLFCGLSNAQAPSQQDVRVLSVCEVFQGIGTFSGKLITLHGELSITRHDVGITSRDCRRTIEVGGHEWPIAIRFARGPYVAIGEATDKDNRRSVEFLDALVRLVSNTYFLQEPTTGPPFHISATFVGTFQARSVDYLAANGPAGFGDQGLFLAELQITAVKDLAISSSEK